MGAEADAVTDLLEERDRPSLAYDPAEGVVGSGLTHGRGYSRGFGVSGRRARLAAELVVELAVVMVIELVIESLDHVAPALEFF